MADGPRNYAIGKPVVHHTISFLAPAEKAPSPAAELLRAAPAPQEAGEKRAVWVVHGMGQQVPFETLDALAQGIIQAAGSHPKGWEISLPPRMVTAEFLSPDGPGKTQVVQRVEIDFIKPGSHLQKMELHLYEAYWAPLTEGVAKLSDVLSFLYDGALHGFLNCFKPFRRAMFPGDRSPVSGSKTKGGKIEEGIWAFKIPRIAAFQIILLMALVFALGAINAVIVAASSAKLNFPLFNAWPVSKNWDQLTAIATAVTAMALTFGAVLFLAEMSRPGDASSFTKGTVRILTWFSLSLAAASILIAAVLMTFISRLDFVAVRITHCLHYHATQFVSTAGILLAATLCAFATRRRAAKRAKGEDHRKGWFPFSLFVGAYLLHLALLLLLALVQFYRFFDPGLLAPVWRYPVLFLGSPFWVWPALLAFSKFLRDLIVEYPGDVAIYVAPNKLDRFNETRQKIKQQALDSLTPLYSACGASPDVPLYSRIAAVGHSLGSVIAYDALNKLLTLDELQGGPIDVAGRTAILETFGSPLDKTAFFFSYQGTENFNIREQLAASVQPLILSYTKFRKFPWINVYSDSDIICGELKFYDVDPPRSAIPPATHPVKNIKDPKAIVPLVAHVEYWKNDTLWTNLLENIL